MYRIQCQCGSRFKLKPQFLGRAIPCPGCRKVIRPVSGGGTIGDFESCLLIEAGPSRVGEQIFLAGQKAIEIGKSQGKTIQLVGTLVSRHHCQLVWTGQRGWRIEDNESTQVTT
jgi:hypothetical protein